MQRQVVEDREPAKRGGKGQHYDRYNEWCKPAPLLYDPGHFPTRRISEQKKAVTEEHTRDRRQDIERQAALVARAVPGPRLEEAPDAAAGAADQHSQAGLGD